MTTGRMFDLGDVLSVTTGKLVAPRHIDAMYDLLGFMTGDTLWTHQLPRACDECAPELLRQHPQLAQVQPPSEFRDADHVWSWLAAQKRIHGDQVSVAPLAASDHTSINPVAELKMMRPDAEVITVVVAEDGAR
jgi:hypothetical protein